MAVVAAVVVVAVTVFAVAVAVVADVVIAGVVVAAVVVVIVDSVFVVAVIVVTGCTNKSGRGKVSFYKLPATRMHKGPQILEIFTEEEELGYQLSLGKI